MAKILLTSPSVETNLAPRPATRGGSATFAADMKRLRIGIILQDVADQQGDMDAYMRRYEPEQPRMPRIAADVAQRLLAAGRAAEAFESRT